MFCQKRLVTIWVIAWMCLLVMEADSVKTKNCLQLIPRDFWNQTVYNESSEQLFISFNHSKSVKLSKCLNLTKSGTEYQLQLVSVSREETGNCCDMECKTASVYHQEDVHDILLNNKDIVPFNYVKGKYFLRLVRVVSEGGGTCEEGSFSSCSSFCSPMLEFGDVTEDGIDKCPDSTNSSEDHLVIINQSYQDTDQVCNFEFDISFPVCHAVQSYSSVNVSNVEVPLNFSCSDLEILDWDNFQVNTTVEQMNPCESSVCKRKKDSLFGAVSYKLQANINTSYCLLVRIQHPTCAGSEDSPRCVFPVSQPAVCSPELLGYKTWLTEPMFVALVVGILVTCLTCLLWIVVKCAQDHVPSLSSSPEPEKEIYKNKNMPRSLTIDEMEHICRLRQQELILVYFPDTEMFKTLNRRFRDWLMSLNILNVNDVIDIYDEKFSDSPDGFLKNPDGWVSNLLSDPERRVVLVTSKLAYECLIHMRKGLDPPKFPENDNYSKLLVHILKYLDSDMFRGNYRRLICVRYEDLKICDRRYGSESFNICPGTEYLLPQHLEDIARWIHPIEARPGLWADHRPQVRHLMEYIKDYRHREDNIFTVSFYNGEDRPLLGNGYYSGY